MAGARGRNNPGEPSDLILRFATEYLVDLNGTEAYIRARAPVKVTRKTAGTNAAKLMMDESVQKLIREARDKAVEKAELTANEVLVKLKQMLMYDPRKMFDAAGNPIPIYQLPDDLAAACVGWKDTIAGREVKLADKVAVLEKAMKYHGLFEKDNKQVGEAISEVLFTLVAPGGKSEPAPG